MGDRSLNLAVFCGPSLYESDRLPIEGVTYLPPAARGDVARAAKEFDAVLLIDGVFHHDLAPAPKECYEATLHARMFGASSMGALRAAECAPYGFTPIGAIANWYLREVIDGDDEVAVLTHPRTDRAITVPMVNVRYVARLAHRRRYLTRTEHDELIRRSRDVFYMDRSWDDVVACAPAHVAREIAKIAHEEGDLKRHDARFALRSVIRALRRNRTGRAASFNGETAVSAVRRSGEVTLPDRCPKFAGTYDRAVSFNETLLMLPALRKRYNITRVADITRLDRVGVPVFSTLVPHSPDLLGVYNGKGRTREASIASAVMEATERQIGAAVSLPTFQETIESVSKRIDLVDCGLRSEVSPSQRVVCVTGTELISGDAVPVPLAMVQCPWFGEKLFDVSSTNGLASGNNATEAVYHALCELIERHVWAMYHVRSSLLPRLFGGEAAIDRSIAPEISLPTGNDVIDQLVKKMEKSGLAVRAFLLEEALLPATVFVSVNELDVDPPMAHMGMGCSLSPTHALIRALTEAVQSRLIDIQGAREDMLRANDAPNKMGEHGRRLKELPRNQWYFDLAAEHIDLRSVADRSTHDLAEDVRLVVDALKVYGIPSVVAVELAPLDLPISVVRAVVPGLESLMFSDRLGSRARAVLNPFAVSV